MSESFDIEMDPIPNADHRPGGEPVPLSGTSQGVETIEIGLTPEGGTEFKITDAVIDSVGGWTANFDAPAGDLTITYDVRAAGDTLASPKACTTRTITVLPISEGSPGGEQPPGAQECADEGSKGSKKKKQPKRSTKGHAKAGVARSTPGRSKK